MRQPRSLWSGQQGSGLAEYALVLVLIAGTAFVAVGVFRSGMDSLYSIVSRRVNAAMEHSFSAAGLASASPLVRAELSNKGKDKGEDRGKKNRGAAAAR